MSSPTWTEKKIEKYCRETAQRLLEINLHSYDECDRQAVLDVSRDIVLLIMYDTVHPVLGPSWIDTHYRVASRPERTQMRRTYDKTMSFLRYQADTLFREGAGIKKLKKLAQSTPYQVHYYSAYDTKEVEQNLKTMIGNGAPQMSFGLEDEVTDNDRSLKIFEEEYNEIGFIDAGTDGLSLM